MAEEESGFESTTGSTTGSGPLPEYTLEEVALHNTKESLWLVIGDKVYDVTSFQDSHPGTATPLLNNAGQDATEGFASVGHSPNAVDTREKLLIGKVARKATDSSTTQEEVIKRPTSSEGGATGQQTGGGSVPRSNDSRGCCGVTTVGVAVGVSVVVVAVAAVVAYKLRSR